MQLGSRIRARRRHLSLTLKDVSAGSGLSVPYLSQIERHQANPTVTSLASIARALGVTLTYFVPDDTPHTSVTRRGAGNVLHFQELPYRVESLAGQGGDLNLEPLLICIHPGFTSDPNSHLGEEFVHVLQGHLRLTVGSEHHELGPGDSAHHPSTTPHTWANPGDTDTLLLWVGTPRLL
ncbi:transcriptional regulator with XRE-family HTH domain [Deinococcus metalli]|uniref:DNA-binding protein n=1 Tax=Deinococcus metalli TaxID=1141878 RepID=A0A7W8KEB4_9DEIO|nr:XRE family transcriptional regulator [Deinococcus metalli]MBB5376571.1 transcriptional regulator with XRE-family HTH domain [Deinococcus metalli]GHF43058.1 DNA-binding protein [Deinococcus metalli]